MLVDSEMDRKSATELGPNNIAVTFVSHFPGDVDVWRTARRQSLSRDGLRSVEEKQIQTPDETIQCLGGEMFRDLVHLSNSTTFTMDCMTTNKLNITYIGNRAGLQEFYDIISQIHKQ
jgi:hypothetical protein